MDDDLLVKYLAGEATPAQKELVQEWVGMSEDNRIYLEQFKKIWDGSRNIDAARIGPDENAAFARLQNRIKNTQQAQMTEIKPVRRFNRLAVAASFVLLCAAGYFAISYFGRVTMVNLQSNNRVLTDTLPDGSVVTMNALSELSYPNKFKGDTRSVKLAGEAFFKITPDKAKPFIIDVNGVTVKVVGTSFNIKSRNDKTEVIVETGVVNVSRDKNSINLNPGERTVVLKSSNSFTRENIKGKLYSYYINRELVCDHTPLSQLVVALNDIYGARIVIAKQSLNQLPITTVFKDQSLNQVLAVITGTFPITVEHSNGRIILK